jgi:hypothetical protein
VHGIEVSEVSRKLAEECGQIGFVTKKMKPLKKNAAADDFVVADLRGSMGATSESIGMLTDA